MSSQLIFLLVSCCVLSALSNEQTTPGVVVRLSQSALDYSAQRAIRLLSQHIQNGVTIPDTSGSSGRTSYSLESMHVKGFQPPRSTVTVHRGTGVSWYLRDADITVGGNWRYRFRRGFFKISDHGGFTMSLSGVSIDIQISLGSDNGRPTISMLRCSSSVGRAHARFSGSLVSWLYNILYRFVEGRVKDAIAGAVCKAVERTIQTDGRRELANLQTSLTILDTFILDYSLVRDPEYGSNYVESFHRGKFFEIGSLHGAPFQPPPMQRDSSAMVSIYVSDYVINSLAYVMHNEGHLSYTFTKNDLPEKWTNVLDMTCSRICLGKIFPSVASSYPESAAELITNVIRPPNVRISGGTVLINFEAEMKIAVSQGDGRHVDLLSVVFGGFVHGSARIANDRIVGHVTNVSLTIANTTIVLPETSLTTPDGLPSLLSNIIQSYSEGRIVPQLNRLAAIGMQLPKLKDINFIRPNLHLRNGFFLVETDVAYRE